MKLLNFKKDNKGFTLLEILVVISIIGILIALGASAFSVAQRKSRDARRRGDLKSMQNAFEQFYAESATSSYAAGCAMTTSFPSGSLPTDPKGGSFAYSCGSSTAAYCVCAELESGTGNGVDNAGSSICTYGGAETHFCVSNLQ